MPTFSHPLQREGLYGQVGVTANKLLHRWIDSSMDDATLLLALMLVVSQLTHIIGWTAKPLSTGGRSITWIGKNEMKKWLEQGTCIAYICT